MYTTQSAGAIFTQKMFHLLEWVRSVQPAARTRNAGRSISFISNDLAFLRMDPVYYDAGCGRRAGRSRTIVASPESDLIHTCKMHVPLGEQLTPPRHKQRSTGLESRPATPMRSPIQQALRQASGRHHALFVAELSKWKALYILLRILPRTLLNPTPSK